MSRAKAVGAGDAAGAAQSAGATGATSSKNIETDRRAHAAGLLLIVCAAWFVPWLVGHADLSRPWLSIPFLLATAIVALASVVSIVNRWQRAVPERHPVAEGQEPRIAVIVPTLGEPLNLLEATVRSVLDQDWPSERLWVLVSDDGHDPRVRALVNRVALAYPRASLRYHTPPKQGDPRRKGEAKAGNLNSALTLLPADIEYVETRDADDLVGDRRFLREAVGQLLACERLAFVQTAKAGRVSHGDPFDNQQPHFFQCAMLSRYAANAVFPCGSGVVWRRAALHEIGDFPTWNLVEDLQSGLEALRRGWEGCYLPILGVYSQHSPEDLANFVKQRGTWALDTVRLTLWAPKRGLSLRQRLQFYELGLFYMQGPATLVFLLAPILGFALHWYPVVTSTDGFVAHFWPFAVALELNLALVHRPMSLEQLWRARLVWAGLCFTYARACVLAVLGGRHGKPRYVVTRKVDDQAWHWRLIVPHALVLALLAGSLLWSLAHRGLLSSFDVGSAYWAGLYSLLLLGFMRLSWHGMPVLSRLRARAPALLASQPSAAAAEVRPLLAGARWPRSREALHQLELRIGEWGGLEEQSPPVLGAAPRIGAQLSPEAPALVSSGRLAPDHAG
ncbi:MAG TPA: glycosyltransferase [Solirubrobacteraceae bacterium]|jgi:cellulose synthase (UDP-forming)|nr:glycosyltransferase [Solirubrobacteraceae bacterium]